MLSSTAAPGNHLWRRRPRDSGAGPSPRFRVLYVEIAKDKSTLIMTFFRTLIGVAIGKGREWRWRRRVSHILCALDGLQCAALHERLARKSKIKSPKAETRSCAWPGRGRGTAPRHCNPSLHFSISPQSRATSSRRSRIFVPFPSLFPLSSFPS